VFEVIRIILEAGHSLTFLSPQANDERYRKALEDIGAECLCDADRAAVGRADEFGAYLRERDFKVAVFVQYFIYNRYAPYFRMFAPECRLVYDALDLEHVRCEREAEVLGTDEARENAATVRREEIAALNDADVVWTVTDVEKEKVAQLAAPRAISVIPTIHAVDADLPGFESRNGIVFLGSYRHRPNVDAMAYFMSDILPKVRESLPDVPFAIAGSFPTDDLYRYEKEWPGVKVTGFIEDMRAFLKTQRVGIAPLRYGAGIKGKIGDYFGCGLPCVTSSIGAEGMGLVNGQDALISDDADEFASAIVRLHTDADLWRNLSQAGADHIRRTLSVEAIGPRVVEALEAAAAVEAKRRGRQGLRALGAILRPRELTHWAATGWRAVRRGGFGELVRQFQVWLHRPPPTPPS